MPVIVSVSGGTTDARTTPVTCAMSRPDSANSRLASTRSSSAVRSRTVARRQRAPSRAPSKIPKTTFVLPASIASSIGLPVANPRRPHAGGQPT